MNEHTRSRAVSRGVAPGREGLPVVVPLPFLAGPVTMLWVVLFVVFAQTAAFAAIGCTLNNPAQDLKYLFPQVTSFREEVRDFTRMGDGKTLYESLKTRLGSDLDPVYEAFDTPFTIYSVYKGQEKIGIVHGVNVPGMGGVIQVFLSTDPQTGEIRDFFFQRLESPVAKALKDKAFREKFKGLGLPDFYKHDYFIIADPQNPADRLTGVRPAKPEIASHTDLAASIRGIRKNLILLDFFVYERQSEPFWERTQKLLAETGGTK